MVAAKLTVNYSSLPASVAPADSESHPALYPPLAIEVTPDLSPIAEPQPSQPSAPIGSTKKRRWSKETEIFISTFLTIFLAELGDKTQLTTLLMAAESHSPWIVFAGAGAALVLTSLLGVWLGCWLAKRISPRTLEIASGVMLLAISALLAWDVIRT